jgi:hypothetical protein
MEQELWSFEILGIFWQAVTASCTSQTKDIYSAMDSSYYYYYKTLKPSVQCGGTHVIFHLLSSTILTVLSGYAVWRVPWNCSNVCIYNWN